MFFLSWYRKDQIYTNFQKDGSKHANDIRLNKKTKLCDTLYKTKRKKKKKKEIYFKRKRPKILAKIS